MAGPASQNRTTSLSIPWSDTVRFIRQLGHDLRNHLNAIELQSAYIDELAENPQLKGEIRRLHEMISRLTSTLQKLSRGLSDVKPNLISYQASDLLDDLRKKIAQEFPAASNEIVWDVQLDDGVLEIDPQMLEQAVIELFANAFQHDRGEGELVVTARIEKGQFIFRLDEPKTRFELATENWGLEPLRNISQGHYGVGLNRVCVIMEAHGGEMHAKYDSKSARLVTMLALPLSRRAG
jgi:K+-sensing histidine kinase KdpD